MVSSPKFFGQTRNGPSVTQASCPSFPYLFRYMLSAPENGRAEQSGIVPRQRPNEADSAVHQPNFLWTCKLKHWFLVGAGRTAALSFCSRWRCRTWVDSFELARLVSLDIDERLGTSAHRSHTSGMIVIVKKPPQNSRDADERRDTNPFRHGRW